MTGLISLLIFLRVTKLIAYNIVASRQGSRDLLSGRRVEMSSFNLEISTGLALTIGMELMYKFHIRGSECATVGTKVRG